jgi:hypothetical protein
MVVLHHSALHHSASHERGQNDGISVKSAPGDAPIPNGGTSLQRRLLSIGDATQFALRDPPFDFILRLKLWLPIRLGAFERLTSRLKFVS